MMVVQPVEWTTDDFVYVSELDSDHQKVFRNIENARQALANGTPVPQLGFLLWRLSRSLSVHLASEERAMRESRYEAFHWHQQQHHAGRAKMAHLLEIAHAKDTQSIAAALQDFTGWLRDHVGLADRMLAAHLRNDRRERLVS